MRHGRVLMHSLLKHIHIPMRFTVSYHASICIILCMRSLIVNIEICNGRCFAAWTHQCWRLPVVVMASSVAAPVISRAARRRWRRSSRVIGPGARLGLVVWWFGASGTAPDSDFTAPRRPGAAGVSTHGRFALVWAISGSLLLSNRMRFGLWSWCGPDCPCLNWSGLVRSPMVWAVLV